jgi:hypothetical protein
VDAAITQITGISAAELAFIDGVTAGTSAASKAGVLGSDSKISALDITALKVGGTAVAATAAEINQACDKSAMIQEITASGAQVITAGVQAV